jgi:hypothetical protein
MFESLSIIAVSRFGSNLWLVEFADWTRVLCSGGIVLDETEGVCAC